jgi:hypothetical protein
MRFLYSSAAMVDHERILDRNFAYDHRWHTQWALCLDDRHY